MASDSFTILQNGFYNQLAVSLGLQPDAPFQMLQPSSPLVVATTGNRSSDETRQDKALWGYFNILPSYSLTHQYIPAGGAQFFSNYGALLSQLVAEPSTLLADVGADVWRRFVAYLSHLKRPAAQNQWPQLFQTWAMLHAPEVAEIGATDLSKSMLFPVDAANMAIAPYAGTGGRAPDWTASYADLVAQLAAAPGRTCDAASASMDSDVSKTWTQGSNSGFFGLWGGSDSSSSLSQRFAESSIDVSGNFAHVTTFQAAPGGWYSSAAMAEAWAEHHNPPWSDPGAWADHFDPQRGDLARFVTALIVVSGMNITVTSNVKLSSDDQAAVSSNHSAGMWPFYSSGDSSGTSTEIKRLDQSGLRIAITSDERTPIVIGCLVLPVDRFTGHAVQTAQALRAAAAVA